MTGGAISIQNIAAKGGAVSIRRLFLGLFATISLPGEALAQRANQNPTTQSDDAFGVQAGTERIGLYSSRDVRGFNPLDAGNARIEGLYYDQLVGGFPNSILNGSAIRVGLSTQGFFFPAPTGIVDYELLRPASTVRGNITVGLGTYSGKQVRGMVSTPLVQEKLGIAGAFEARDRESFDGTREKSLNYGMVAEWRPYSGANVVLLGGGDVGRDREAGPRFFVNGDFLPPRIERGRMLGQPWARGDSTSSIFGAIARLPLSQSYQLEVSAFRNREVADSISDVLSGVDEDGAVTRRTIIVDRNRPQKSNSGEVRLVRSWQNWGLSHRLAASARLRRQDRAFGGAQRYNLGPSTIWEPDVRPEPEYIQGVRSSDKVRQLTYGLAYSAVLGNKATFDAGISRSDYRKMVDFADPTASDVETVDNPILWNVAGSVLILPKLTAYAGITRGLEDASIAPDFAANRDVAPPAIRTRQEDASLRWNVANGVSLILGAFRITKPYYNVDAVNQYRLLGEVSTQGVEVSLAGQVHPGVSVVFGTVFMDPAISGEPVDAGVIGARPIGSANRKSVMNVDWRMNGGEGALSVDLAVTSESEKVANALNTFSAPASLSFDLGARYRFDAYGLKMVLRPRLLNLFDQYVWRVSSGGSQFYNDRRRFSVELLTDF